MPGGRRRVVVAVLTFRRADLLALMLPGLVGQAARSPHDVVVLVVDNDAAGSAAATVAAEPAARYVVEPTPGIVAARNRALDEARASAADAVVFIDDDEQAAPGWLDALTAEWVRSGAAAVVGPAVPPDDLELPPWAAGSGYFRRRRRLATGTPVPSFPTANVLIDLATLTRLGLRFDPRFSASGGEDTVLSLSMTAAGAVARWCDEAVVIEHVPAERLTRAFVLRRVRRRATTWVQAELLVTPAPRRRGRRLELSAQSVRRGAPAAARVLAGTLRRDLPQRARAERDLARAVGMVAGLLGRTHDEYGPPRD